LSDPCRHALITRGGLKISFLLFLCFSAVLLSLHSGSAQIKCSEILCYFFNCSGSISEQSAFILSHLRIPRTEAAFLIGASLGTCGLVLQTLLRNPLAEPYTLGLSGGSAVGAVIALYFSFSPSTFWIPALSSVGCLISVILVLGLAKSRFQTESRTLILFGVMISLFFGAVVVSGLSILSPEKLQEALFWLLGEFGTSRDQWIGILKFPLLLGLFCFLFKSHALDALALGEIRARALGYSPVFEMRLLIFICTLLTGISVSIVGLVGFIGLVSPHLARRFLKSSNHRHLLIASGLFGASLLTAADSLARLLAGSGEIPAGSIAALLGAPVLIFLLGAKNHAQGD
jgi:iron complex transport system permease protein